MTEHSVSQVKLPNPRVNNDSFVGNTNTRSRDRSDIFGGWERQEMQVKLNREFLKFVGDEKRCIKIVSLDSNESSQTGGTSLDTSSGSSSEIGTESRNFTDSIYQYILKDFASEYTDSKEKEKK